ncbi:MAG: metal-dependent hydrolase [Burkholderiaceae bacterium]|nr:metal-dependent hydrolase [Burkholderiaceae bacterium]
MDSVTQFALGAAVGVAVMGRRVSFLRAALWGGVCGTLPDLDAFIDHGDPVSNMTLHRSETHAIFWQTLATPLIAAAIAWTGRTSKSMRKIFPRWLLAVWLVLVTHALLDATTVYGTRLGLPFTDHPFALGSIFIIDPLYTLPLIAGLLLAGTSRSYRATRWNGAGLALSTLYLAWSAAAQWYVGEAVARELAQGEAPAAQRMLVTPAPFNTVLWRVLVMRADSYDEGFLSLLDRGRAIRFERFARDAKLYEQARELPRLKAIAEFSRGFFRVDERDGRVVISDLRMGIEPAYMFQFAVGLRSSPIRPIEPVSIGGLRGVDFAAAMRWLLARIGGADLMPPRTPAR